MPTTPVTPYVPQYITVHLGAPSAAAENVTVSFPEYVKNVASSEIYPTWEPAAIRANILAIISFALNRGSNNSVQYENGNAPQTGSDSGANNAVTKG